VYAGEFSSLQQLTGDAAIFFKEHPLYRHYQGNEEARDWIVPDVKGDFPSFFSYWKKISRHIQDAGHRHGE
jgi:deoxyribodipyrimidine photo-lyase